MPRGRPSHRPAAVREARVALLEANPLRAEGSTSFAADIVEHVYNATGEYVTPFYVRKILGRSGHIGHEKGAPSPGKRVKRLEDTVRRAEVERALRNRGDASNNEVARRLGISPGNLRLWVKDLESVGRVPGILREPYSDTLGVQGDLMDFQDADEMGR